MGSLNLFHRIENYIISRLLLLKLESHELIGKLIVLLVTSFLFIGMFILIMFFLGMTFSLLLGELLGNNIYGFAATTLFYVVVLLVLILYREKFIEGPIMDIVIRELNKTKDDDDMKTENNLEKDN